MTTLQTKDACPLCGLMCSGITISSEGSVSGCNKTLAAIKTTPTTASPTINGKTATFEEAVAKSAAILREANLPVFAGLGTEVYGMRAVMRLADKSSAVVDHMNSSSSVRNTHVLQNSGWMTTTLTEVKNRVDLLIAVGTDIISNAPEFFDRVIWNKETLFDQDTSKREIVYLGGNGGDTSAGVSPDGRQPQILPCAQTALPEVIGALRAILNGKKLVVSEVAGIQISALEALAQKMRDAKYCVVVWAAGQLSFDHAELTIQNLTELIKGLNATTRCNGLALSGVDGDISVNQTSTWISGFPVRMSYSRGFPEYDPELFAADKLIVSDQADALFWISSFNPERRPIASKTPTVVIGHPNMQFDESPDVFIPVGIPGIDHRGIMFRADSAIAVPLKKLRESSLPALADVLQAIEHAL